MNCSHASEYFELVEKSFYRFRCKKCKSTMNSIYVDKGDDVIAVSSIRYKTPHGFISRGRLISHLVDAMGNDAGFSDEWVQRELEKEDRWTDNNYLLSFMEEEEELEREHTKQLEIKRKEWLKNQAKDKS
jgi:hypothetical protein